MFVFLVLAVCVAFLISTCLDYQLHFKYWKIRGIPSARAWPFFGSFIQSAFQRLHFIDEIDSIYKKYCSSSPYVGFFVGIAPQLLIFDPKLIKDILITNFKNFNENGSMADEKTDPLLARNPFVLCGREWKEKRSEIIPAFCNQKIKAMKPIVEDTCMKLTLYIKKKIEENSAVEFNAKQMAERYSTDVVSNCIYGIDSKAFSQEESVIHKMGSKLLPNAGLLMLYSLLTVVLPFIDYFYKMPLMNKKSSNFFVKLTNDSVAMREASGLHRDDFLNYLLELKNRKNISEIDLAAHTVNFFLDGFQTSSSVIAYALYYLGRYPEVQNQLRKEIQLSVKHGKVTFEELTQMVYLDQVFYETLRIRPPIAYMSKVCTVPTEMTDQNGNEILIERGIVVGIPVYSIHNDPEHYADPSEFRPDRFSDGGLKSLKEKGVFLGFGAGPRTCLGMRFGTMQVKAAIAEIVQNFEITVNTKTKEPLVTDPQTMVSMPVGGLWLNFKTLTS